MVATAAIRLHSNNTLQALFASFCCIHSTRPSLSLTDSHQRHSLATHCCSRECLCESRTTLSCPSISHLCKHTSTPAEQEKEEEATLIPLSCGSSVQRVEMLSKNETPAHGECFQLFYSCLLFFTERRSACVSFPFFLLLCTLLNGCLAEAQPVLSQPSS